MEGFQINYMDLSDLSSGNISEKIENLIENIDNCIEKSICLRKMQNLQENRRRSKELSLVKHI